MHSGVIAHIDARLQLPSKADPSPSSMSTLNAQNLTPEEQILHHNAAMVKKDLEAYRVYSRTQEDWNKLFQSHLARDIFIMYFYKPIIFI